MPDVKRGRGTPQREVLEYLEVPIRHRWLVVGPVVVCALAALVASFLLPAKFRSSTLILVESEKVPEPFVPNLATERVTQRLQKVQQEVLSRTRLERVAQDLDPYETVGKQPLGEVITAMRKAITVRVRGNDSFLIEYVHSDPHVAQRVTDRLARLFIEETTQAREKQVSEAFDFISSQLADARRDLEQREAGLREYKQRHMGTLPEQTNTNLSVLQRMQLEQQAIAEQMRTASERLTQLESSSEPTRLSSDRRARLSALRAQLESLRARYTDEHPDVKATRAQIAALEAESSSESLAGQGASHATELQETREELKRLKARREENDKRSRELEARVEQAPRTEEELSNLTRDFQQLNANYLSLLNKRMEAQMAAKLEQRWRGEQFSILDPADLPADPFFPNRKLLLLAGLLAGIGMGVAAAYGADFIDHSVRSEKELGEMFPFAVLAVVPYVDPRRDARVRTRFRKSLPPHDRRSGRRQAAAEAGAPAVPLGHEGDRRGGPS
jgi:succinoglycan biosynthesis transport protein ExoP